ncbi:hypothetical protein DMUE_6165, partial [Dictyocoela muelleri]
IYQNMNNLFSIETFSDSLSVSKNYIITSYLNEIKIYNYDLELIKSIEVNKLNINQYVYKLKKVKKMKYNHVDFDDHYNLNQNDINQSINQLNENKVNEYILNKDNISSLSISFDDQFICYSINNVLIVIHIETDVEIQKIEFERNVLKLKYCSRDRRIFCLTENDFYVLDIENIIYRFNKIQNNKININNKIDNNIDDDKINKIDNNIKKNIDDDKIKIINIYDKSCIYNNDKIKNDQTLSKNEISSLSDYLKMIERSITRGDRELLKLIIMNIEENKVKNVVKEIDIQYLDSLKEIV